MEGTLDVNVYPSDIIFNETQRILLFGSSNTGKTHLVEQLVKRHVDRFYRIVICGNRNRLLDFPQTKNITELYGGRGAEGDGIFDPFTEIEPYVLKKKKDENKQMLVIYDDMMEAVYKSPVVSKIFSKGRHLGVSSIVILQSYFPTGKGQNLFPQIKNNSTIQIFTKARSQGEIGMIAARLEFGKRYRDFFMQLFKKEVQEKRFGYLAVQLDCSDGRLKYYNNLVREDGTPYLTLFV